MPAAAVAPAGGEVPQPFRWLRTLVAVTVVGAGMATGGCSEGQAVGNSMLDVGLLRVQDRANIIPATDELDLTRKSEALERATTDQLVVVTVPTLRGQDIAKFATTMANRQGIGQADKDNGVLLLVAPNERKVRIAVGYGLEGLLTDARAAEIVQHMLPRFRAGDQAGAIRTGVVEVDAMLRSDKRRPQFRMKKAA
jgi:uncharacterized protein